MGLLVNGLMDNFEGFRLVLDKSVVSSSGTCNFGSLRVVLADLFGLRASRFQG